MADLFMHQNVTITGTHNLKILNHGVYDLEIPLKISEDIALESLGEFITSIEK